MEKGEGLRVEKGKGKGWWEKEEGGKGGKGERVKGGKGDGLSVVGKRGWVKRSGKRRKG